MTFLERPGRIWGAATRDHYVLGGSVSGNVSGVVQGRTAQPRVRELSTTGSWRGLGSKENSLKKKRAFSAGVAGCREEGVQGKHVPRKNALSAAGAA